MTYLWWLLLGDRQLRQDVGPFVVLPRYVFQGCFAETGDAIFGRVEVSLQQRFLHLELFIDLANHHLGVAFARNLACSHVVG